MTADRPVITIDPAIRFGRPQIGGISCDAIAERVHAGDTALDVAAEYGLSRAQVLLACCWIGISPINPPAAAYQSWPDWALASHVALARGEHDKISDPPAREQAGIDTRRNTP